MSPDKLHKDLEMKVLVLIYTFINLWLSKRPKFGISLPCMINAQRGGYLSELL